MINTFFGTSPRSRIFLEQTGIKFDSIVDSKEKLNKANGDLGMILDFKYLIPPSVVNKFKHGIINIHFSKLPLDRGPARGHQFILRGDNQAWISYFLITDKLDDGPILKQTSLPLDQTETGGELSAKLVTKAALEIKAIVNNYLTGKIIPSPPAGRPSYVQKLTDAQIDWQKPAVEIERLIRAANPEPGAWTEIQVICDKQYVKRRLKILKAHMEQNKLILDLVQLEGKKPVSYRQFVDGYPNATIIK